MSDQIKKKAKAERKLVRSVQGVAASDGAGVKLYRVMGTHLLGDFDPFLMIDEFRSDNPDDYLAGFPSHPHRGFETITYMLAGAFEHQDNNGNKEALSDGEVQWMTTGKGIIHSEMPIQKNGLVWGFQIWLNLPARTKMQDPSYKNLRKKDIPVFKLDNGIEIKSIAGRLTGIEGAFNRPDTDPILLDVSLPANVKWSVEIPDLHQCCIYTIENKVSIISGDTTEIIEARHLGLLSNGSRLNIGTENQAARLLLLAGIPLNEPMVKHGPFVMNSIDEIKQAIDDYQSGRF